MGTHSCTHTPPGITPVCTLAHTRVHAPPAASARPCPSAGAPAVPPPSLPTLPAGLHRSRQGVNNSGWVSSPHRRRRAARPARPSRRRQPRAPTPAPRQRWARGAGRALGCRIGPARGRLAASLAPSPAFAHGARTGRPFRAQRHGPFLTAAQAMSLLGLSLAGGGGGALLCSPSPGGFGGARSRGASPGMSCRRRFGISCFSGPAGPGVSSVSGALGPSQPWGSPRGRDVPWASGPPAPS